MTTIWSGIALAAVAAIVLPPLMMEFVPTGQTVDNWKQMITVQHFPKLTGGDPLCAAGDIACAR